MHCAFSFSLSWAFLGCRTTQPFGPELEQAQELHAANDEAPSLTIEALDPSIPLGDAFPIAVKISNAEPNVQWNLEMIGVGITPSTITAAVTTDASGNAELRLTGKSTKPKLNSLDVLGYSENGDALTGSVYVNFEPPQEGELQAQAAGIVGEPTTIDEYFATLPVATSKSELEAIQAEAPPAVIADNVSLSTEDGTSATPIDAVILNSPEEVIETQAVSSCANESTYVYLKTAVSGSIVNIPVGTNTAVKIGSTWHIRKVEESGRISFSLGCSTLLTFQVGALDGSGSTGIFMTTGNGRTISWSKSIRSWSGAFSADSIRGQVIKMSEGADSFSLSTQRLYFRVNQVYNWERKFPKPGQTFDRYRVEVYFPYGGAGGLSNYGVINYPDGFAYYDAGIFHEFGHQVYYLRMLGLSEYNQRRNGTPFCPGSLGWLLWEEGDGCSGLLEGWAVWFENIAAAKLNTYPGRSIETNRWSEDDKASSYGVPGNIAGYLWDTSDHHGSDPDIPNSDGDLVVNTDSLDARYKRVADRFDRSRFGAITDMREVWGYEIKPDLEAVGGTACNNHHRTLLKNYMAMASCR